MSEFRVSRVGEPDVILSFDADWVEPDVSEGVLRVGMNYFAPGVWTSCITLGPVVADV